MVSIEPIEPAHLSPLQKFAADLRIGATSNVPSPYPEDGALRWYKEVRNRVERHESCVFAIRDDRTVCGVVSLNNINQVNRTAELDYWVAVEHQNKGIATQAAQLATHYARNTLGLKVLYSSCLARNVASSRVLEKNGFEELEVNIFDTGKFKGERSRRFRLQLHNIPLNSDAQNTRAG